MADARRIVVRERVLVSTSHADQQQSIFLQLIRARNRSVGRRGRTFERDAKSAIRTQSRLYFPSYGGISSTRSMQLPRPMVSSFLTCAWIRFKHRGLACEHRRYSPVSQPARYRGSQPHHSPVLSYRMSTTSEDTSSQSITKNLFRAIA